MALKIKKGDKVIVIAGKNKGATGEVLKIMLINTVKIIKVLLTRTGH